jgi:hypothetical protein
MEAACRTAFAKGEVGIFELVAAPTLKQFARRFIDYVETRSKDRPATISFYADQLRCLLRFEPLRDAKLDQIDERVIETFIAWRSCETVRDGAKRRSPAQRQRPLSAWKR